MVTEPELVLAWAQVLVQALELALAPVRVQDLAQEAEQVLAPERVSGLALEPEPESALALDSGLVLELELALELELELELALESERGWLNRLRRRRRSTPMRNSPSEGGLIAMPQAALP